LRKEQFVDILTRKLGVMMMYKSIFASVFCLVLLGNAAYSSELRIGSWGGNVRSGPSTDYARVGSLKNGDPVVLLKRERFSGGQFDWFKITYGQGQIGYQWGGILCGFSNKVNGTFGICEKDNRSTPRSYKCHEQSQLRSLGSKRKTMITFFAGQTDDMFKIYWLDYDGEKVLYNTLNAEMSWTAETYPSHPWVVYRVSEDGTETCHSIVRGNNRPSQWLLR
jgi:hypothetical protein